MIGAMSGTSADGVDVALVRLSGRGTAMQAEFLRHHDRAFDPRLASRIQAIRTRGETTLRDLAEVGRVVSLVYAIAVNELLVAAATPPDRIACIAAHGQTLFHAPPLTIQWLDPALLAARTNCTVVSDFRRADCAYGGQGAPLVPFADYLLFRDAARSRMLVNIGGIANVTWLPAGGGPGQVVAFDTGPGNCICDWLMQKRSGDGRRFDAGGELALKGRPLEPLLEAVLAAPYFSAGLPKSTDGPAMVRIFEQEMVRLRLQDATLPDLLATACEITVRSIAAARDCCGSPQCQWIAAGGGVENKAMLQSLTRVLGQPVLRTSEFGVPTRGREAVAFALLGAATLDGEPANLPQVTGASRAVPLGSVTRP